MDSGPSPEDEVLMNQAIQESIRENPNPDVMSYEQLQELGDRMGTVSKGYSKSELQRIRPQANFDHIEDCAI